MAVIPKAYGLMLQSLWEGRINLSIDPLMCALCAPGYTPNQGTHKFRSIVTNEILGSGYAPGGMQITGAQLTYEIANKRLLVTGSSLVWPSVTFPSPGPKWGVLYVDNGGPITAQPLVAYVDFGENVVRSDEPFTITWPVTGILNQTVT